MNVKKYGIMLIASVLLVGLVFAGAGSAADATNTSISSWAELEQNITNWNDVGGTGMLTIKLNTGFKNESGSEGDYNGVFVARNVTIMPASDTGDEVTLDANQMGRLFYVGGGNLTLTGNGTQALNLTGGKTRGDATDKGGAGILVDGGNLTIREGASITNCNSSESCGGGVSVISGMFILDGGNITGCSTGTWGGGVYFCTWCTFIMNSGTISGCTAASDYGDGVVVSLGTTFNMNGGTISEDNSVLLCSYADDYMITKISVPSTFNGKVGNITFYDGKYEDDLAVLLGMTVVENGASVDSWENKFKLSSAYTSNYLKAVNGDLILGSDFYPIYITNATGTYQLKEAMTKVDGDYGVANGTASVEKEDGMYVLTLDNFKASNSTNVPIIRAAVPNLTVKLVGDSNLTGSLDSDGALLYTLGNLTITTDSSGKLLVNNTATGGYAICAEKDITISGGTINATVDGYGCAIYAVNNLTVSGGTITATTDSAAIRADNDVTISGGTITATASDDGCAIYAENNVTVSGGTINATADSVAIRAENDITISGGTITATATLYGVAIYAEIDITITSVDQFIVNGTAAAFEYGNARDFSALGDNYEYWVNSTGPALPLINLNYTQFNASENWTGSLPIMSVYTNVTIKPITYTVSFAMQGHGTQIAQQEVRKGSCAEEPTAPTASGYTFGGWFEESSCTNVWDFDTPVMNDTILYAKWTPKQSSNKDMGSTVILTEPVTPTPVPTATPTATAVPTIATVNPTSQQTSKSPVPVFGLIAGLGAAAVLLRLRK